MVERTEKEMSTSRPRCDEAPPPARPEGCLKPTLEVDGLVPAAVNSVEFFMGFSSALPGPSSRCAHAVAELNTLLGADDLIDRVIHFPS